MRTVYVDSPGQLLSAVREWGAHRIELELPHLEAAEARIWEERLNEALNSCGCDEGAVGMTGGLAVSFAAVLLGVPAPLPWAAATAVVIFSALAAAIGGKIVGMLMGRRRAVREAAKLAALLADGSPAPLGAIGSQGQAAA